MPHTKNNINDPTITSPFISKPKSKLNFCQNASPSEYKLRTIHKIMPTPQMFFFIHMLFGYLATVCQGNSISENTACQRLRTVPAFTGLTF